MPKLESFNYDSQLGYLQSLIFQSQRQPKAEDIQMLLSIAESVKRAREAELNTPLETPEEVYKRGLADAAVVVEYTRGIDKAQSPLIKALADGIRLFSHSDVPAKRFLYTVW